MSAADIAKFGAIAYFLCIGLWFATAQPHFDSTSRARPLLFAVVGLSAVLSITTIVFLIREKVPDGRLIVTVAVATASALLFRWALKSIARKNLGLAFSGIVPNEIVKHGPYRFIRHPLYTAYSFFWLSCAFLTASVVAGALAIAIVLLYVVAARSEERDILHSELGPAYRDYRKRTGLLLPRLFR